MADYQEMYGRLFRAITKSIEILQQVQQETEELYLSAEENIVQVFPGKEELDKKD